MSAAIGRAVVAAVVARGVTADALYRSAELEPSALSDVEGMVSVRDLQKLARAAMQLCKDASLGLGVGAVAPVGMLHAVGHVIVACRTLRAAFDHFARFAPLVEPGARYALNESGAVACYSYEPAHAPDVAMRRFHTEVCFAFTSRLARQMLAVAQSPTEVRLAYPAPAYALAYEQTFGCPARFDAPASQLVFPAEVLDAPLLLAHPGVFDVVRDRAETLLAEAVAEPATHQQVQSLLGFEVRLADVTETAIARKLGIAPRTLRRRLSAEGHTFSSLMDDARRHRACIALRGHRASVKELADMLGFSEPSALHRAFKRWTGQTIGAYRASVPQRA